MPDLGDEYKQLYLTTEDDGSWRAIYRFLSADPPVPIPEGKPWAASESYLRLSVTREGNLYLHVAAEDSARASRLIDNFKKLLPAYAVPRTQISVTFWSLGGNGPVEKTRYIDSVIWEDVADNYPQAEGLAETLTDFTPGESGQLILWHGKPGTGKTTALRALAHQWRDWASLHYIVDPDQFFGNSAAYMMHVLIEDAEKERWRVIVLEDAGELLAPDARATTGQALSRLLNACDGLIGRGLRILILVTTNEPLEQIHDAVSRPGRCAAITEFKEFSETESQAWLGARGAAVDEIGGRKTLAELYAILEHRRLRARGRPIGFTGSST